MNDIENICGSIDYIEHPDYHHLVKLLIKQYHRITRGKPSDNLEVILDELAAYVLHHFYCEEHCAACVTLSNAGGIKYECDRMILRIAEFRKLLVVASTEYLLQNISFYINWLFQHKYGNNYRQSPL